MSIERKNCKATLPVWSSLHKKVLRLYAPGYVVGMVAGSPTEKVMKTLKSHCEKRVGMLMRHMYKVRGQRKLDINEHECVTSSFLLSNLSIDMEIVGGWVNRVG